jgi:hypothetical protein
VGGTDESQLGRPHSLTDWRRRRGGRDWRRRRRGGRDWRRWQRDLGASRRGKRGQRREEQGLGGRRRRCGGVVVGGVGAVVATVGGVGAAAVGSGVTGSRPGRLRSRTGVGVRLERISVGFQHGPGQKFAGQTNLRGPN